MCNRRFNVFLNLPLHIPVNGFWKWVKIFNTVELGWQNFGSIRLDTMYVDLFNLKLLIVALRCFCKACIGSILSVGLYRRKLCWRGTWSLVLSRRALSATCLNHASDRTPASVWPDLRDADTRDAVVLVSELWRQRTNSNWTITLETLTQTTPNTTMYIAYT